MELNFFMNQGIGFRMIFESTFKFIQDFLLSEVEGLNNIEDMSELNAPTNYEIFYKKNYKVICVMDLEGFIVYANQPATALFGYTNEELIKLNYNEIVTAEEFKSFYYYFHKVLEGETHEIELGVNCKKGNILEVQVIMVPNEINGQIINISLYIREIPKQRKFELKLNQKELCESFIESNRDPILLLDLNATIVLANRTFSDLLGWRKENLEGFHILSCPSIPPHLVEQMRDYYHRVVSSKYNSDGTVDSELFTLETIRVSNEEKAYHMMLSITPIHDHNEEVCNWAVHLRDITAQKEIEKSLLRAEKLLAVGQIAAGLTHEIRNPLQSLKGLTQLIKTSRDEIDNFDGYLDIMLDELNQIENFVDGFALFGRTKLNSYKMTDINVLLQEVILSLKSQALLNNVNIELKLDKVPTIWSEEELLKQAIFNVIQNGIESMQSGGTLHIGTKPDGDMIEMNVTDFGVGIPEDRFQNLGEPFYSNKEKGFGLGLMLTYKVIEQHHGKVTIQSKVGIGTQVNISFPVTIK